MAEFVNTYGRRLPPKLPAPERLAMHYDDALDTLFISTQPAQAAVSVDIEGEMWVRFVPETAEVVGVEIEDFESSFLPSRPDVAAAWRNGRGPEAASRLWSLLRPESFLPHLLPAMKRWRDESR